jgi:hypothetical protein
MQGLYNYKKRYPQLNSVCVNVLCHMLESVGNVITTATSRFT